jgi:hypothetical protein
MCILIQISIALKLNFYSLENVFHTFLLSLMMDGLTNDDGLMTVLLFTTFNFLHNIIKQINTINIIRLTYKLKRLKFTLKMYNMIFKYLLENIVN